MKEYRGLTYYPEFKKIFIDSKAPLTYQAEALIHEWAHIRAGTICHGLLWERQYGKIYRAWEKTLTP